MDRKPTKSFHDRILEQIEDKADAEGETILRKASVKPMSEEDWQTLSTTSVNGQSLKDRILSKEKIKKAK
jgi:hypothetical protein